MLDEVIGDLQLDEWADGTAVVSRPSGTAKAAGAEGRVPVDPDAFDFLSGMRPFSFVLDPDDGEAPADRPDA